MAKKDNGKVCSILSYVLVGIIWFFVDNKMRRNKSCKFHAQQGAVFLIFYIIWGIVVSIILGVLRGILALVYYSGSAVGMGLFGTVIALVGFIAWVVPLILLVIGMVNAANNKNKNLPIIGRFAKKLKF